jgi:hypothetical protein
VTDPNVISIGEDFRDFSPEHWGRDRARAAREDRAKSLLEASKPVPREFSALPGRPVNLSISSLYGAPSPPGRNARGRALDERLQKLGIDPRPKRS